MEAVKQRRRRGWMREEVLDILDSSCEPLTAHQIAQAVSGRDPGIHHSAVYRTLSQLLSARVIDRIEVLAGYVLSPGRPSVTLICSKCASAIAIDGQALHNALSCLSDQRGFRPHRYVTEIIGCCADCTALSRPATMQDSLCVAAGSSPPPLQPPLR